MIGNGTEEIFNATRDAVVTATPAIAEEVARRPGFEAVFAIAGLLAVAYLVLRQRGNGDGDCDE